MGQTCSGCRNKKKYKYPSQGMQRIKNNAESQTESFDGDLRVVQRRAEDDDQIDVLPEQDVVDAIRRERDVEREGRRGRLFVGATPNGLNPKTLIKNQLLMEPQN